MPFKPGRTTRSMSPLFLSSVHDHPVPRKLKTIAPLPCLCRFIPFILLSSASNQGDRDSLQHSIPSKQRRRRIIGTWGAFALKFLNCIADVVVVVGTRPNPPTTTIRHILQCKLNVMEHLSWKRSLRFINSPSALISRTKLHDVLNSLNLVLPGLGYRLPRRTFRFVRDDELVGGVVV